MWFYLHFTVMWLPNLNMSPEPKHAWDVHFTQSLPVVQGPVYYQHISVLTCIIRLSTMYIHVVKIPWQGLRVPPMQYLLFFVKSVLYTCRLDKLQVSLYTHVSDI
jgi:hypothetical protein